MHVLLLQLDGSIPNLALMRISAHHKAKGDSIELSRVATVKALDSWLMDSWDRIYASLIFERSRSVAEALRRRRPDAIIGGTGWDLMTTLERHGIREDTLPDYGLYPLFRSSLGFTQRGCRLKCSFCVVPSKEGKVREVATIADIWRGEPWPREVLLLDNDFFGQPNWRERIRELRDGNFKVSFNQGINARMLTDETAEAIASVNYRDDSMKVKRIYTAFDNRRDECRLFAGLDALVRYGVQPDHIMVYMLIGYWPWETEQDWLYRQQRLRDFGARPYPMPFDRSNKLAVGFQRWCVRRADLKVSWEEYKAVNCRPEKLKLRRRIELPLFDGLA